MNEIVVLVPRVAKDDALQLPDRRVSQPSAAPAPRRIAHAFLLFLGIVIVVDSLVGERGLLAMLGARRQHEELAAAIERQRAENTRCEKKSAGSPKTSAIEEIARRELGLIRPGEKVFILKDLPGARQALT